MKKLLTPKKASAEIGHVVSVSMLYQLCEEKRLTHLRVGGKGKRGKILIDLNDLLEFLEAQKILGSESVEIEQRSQRVSHLSRD